MFPSPELLTVDPRSIPVASSSQIGVAATVATTSIELTVTVDVSDNSTDAVPASLVAKTLKVVVTARAPVEKYKSPPVPALEEPILESSASSRN